MGNPISNAILEQIHQVLRNLVRNFNILKTYVNENDPYLGVLSSASFEIRSTTNRFKRYSPLQLVSGRDMILPIKHKLDW